ncbi:choline transport protein, partial [Tremellales sp. Uapishka_1]
MQVLKSVDLSPNVVEVGSGEDARLEDLGYKPELKRAFSRLETFGVAFSIMGVVPSIASTIFYNLPYGGPVAMIYGWIIAAILIMFVGLSMNGLSKGILLFIAYYIHPLTPAQYRDFLAWMVGYNSFLGNVAAVSSLAWACSGIFFAAASIANADFTPTAGATFGLYVGILVFCGVFCAYGTALFARLQTPSVVLNVLLSLVTILGLPIARRKNLNTAQFTFGGFVNLTSWPSGFAFLLSFLAPVWTICESSAMTIAEEAGSFDCAVSISEEASNASIAVPQAIVGAIGSAGVLGAIILVILALTMGPDVAAINDAAIGQPLAYIYLQAFGVNGSLVVWSFMCLAQISMTASLVLPSSRQAFAFARDGALPFSKFFRHINPKTGTPVRAVWLIVGAAIPLGALGFADPVNESAINAIFTLAIMGPYVAYGIPIASRLIWGRDSFIPGPFYLGRYSNPVAWVAIGWMMFAIVIFCFPADTNPDASSMNYAIVVAAGVWAFAIAYWFLPKVGGKTFFRGPVSTENAEDLEERERSVGKGSAEESVKNMS